MWLILMTEMKALNGAVQILATLDGEDLCLDSLSVGEVKMTDGCESSTSRWEQSTQEEEHNVACKIGLLYAFPGPYT